MENREDRAARGRFSWPVRVYYEDTDAGGVVYYANYLKFFERARTERLRVLGFEQDELRSSQALIFAVKSVRVDYLRPARFNDALRVSAEVTEIKQASLSFAQEIHREGPGAEKLCEAEVKIVCLNDGSFRPTAIPEFLLQRIKDDI